MIRLLLFFSLVFFCCHLSGQSKQGNEQGDYEPNCYEKYANVFEKRGAREVEDGTYKEIIVTIRNGPRARCYIGKAEVEGGKVKHIYRMQTDSSYAPLQKEFKHEDKPVSINNGMSRTKVTEDGELVKVLFVDHIKPEEKGFIEAPEPDFDENDPE